MGSCLKSLYVQNHEVLPLQGNQQASSPPYRFVGIQENCLIFSGMFSTTPLLKEYSPLMELMGSYFFIIHLIIQEQALDFLLKPQYGAHGEDSVSNILQSHLFHKVFKQHFVNSRKVYELEAPCSSCSFENSVSRGSSLALFRLVRRASQFSSSHHRKFCPSQFDGNAAFSGGGFMPSQTTQGTDPSFMPSKNRDAQSLLPLTVKQIYDAFQSSDDKTNLIVDGVDINNVTLVGRVCNKVGRITDVTFVLDDGTGRIECNKWLQEAVDANEAEGILDGMYVRLHGPLKSFHGKRCLNVFSFRPVTDFNEIASHFIDCIYVHLYNSRLRHLQTSVPNQQHVMNSMPTTSTVGYQAQPVPPTNQFYDQHINGQKSVEAMVVDFLHLPANRSRSEGVARDLIAQHLGISLDKLMLAVQNLIDEGAIYETISDHYKSIVNG
ncbi:hypothetical protein VNO78_23339 [Psophocarpus tetragonolobus]|uniref:Replication protein A C-terminal domain-containing protein n=1 Tax=Psophocarpus tetragonolobus TaxID=3891 RepID=A0AAN9S3U3_PSOTE